MAFDFFGAFHSIVLAVVDNPAFLIIMVIAVFMIPLSVLGVYQLTTWFGTWSKLRGGWIQVRKKLSNGRWVTFWARPTGRKIKVKGEEGMEFEVPIAIEKDMMGYQSDLKAKIKSQVKSKGKVSKLLDKVPIEVRIEKIPEKPVVIGKSSVPLTPEQKKAVKDMIDNV